MEAVGYVFAFALIASLDRAPGLPGHGEGAPGQVRDHRRVHCRGPAGALAAAGEAQAGHRPLGRDDPGLRGRQGEPAGVVQHGRADRVAEAPGRPRRSARDPDPQDRQQPARDHPAGRRGRGGRRGQADADRRRRSGVPHPGQPQARRDRDRPGARPGRPGQAAGAVPVGQARRDLDREEPQVSPPTRSPTRARTGRRTATPGSTSSSPARTAPASSRPRWCRSLKNTAEHALPEPAPQPEVDRLVPGRVQPERDPRRRPDEPPPERSDHPRGPGLAGAGRAVDPLQPRPPERHRQVPGPRLLARPGRAAPAGRRLRLQPDQGLASSAS